MDYIARLEVPPDQTTWRGDAVPRLTAAALWPVPETPDLPVTKLLRIDFECGKEVLRPLSDADRATLDAHWSACDLPPVAAQMTTDDWVPYLDAFNRTDKGRPADVGWRFAVMPPHDPNHIAHVSQAVSAEEHRKRLQQAIEAREIIPRLPGAMTEAPTFMNLQHVVLTKSELTKFAAMVCVEVVDGDRPLAEQPRFPVAIATTDAPPVEIGRSAEDAPQPLSTCHLAHCFAGLRMTEEQWKKRLGNKPKWLQPCVSVPGQQGVRETRWDPVCIGAALVRTKHVNARSVRAKFQSQPLLVPWFDAWKTYEAEFIDDD